MSFWEVLKIEFIKVRRSKIVPLIFIAPLLVVVSGIAKWYKPEDMIGKTVVFVANLKPAKFAGVVSNGMLLAASADSCGCKIIFVDDSVPEGTAIH